MKKVTFVITLKFLLFQLFLHILRTKALDLRRLLRLELVRTYRPDYFQLRCIPRGDENRIISAIFIVQ